LDSYTIESKKKSRIPARLDFAQSATGLMLGLFVYMHLFFDSSIILGKNAFSFVSKILEFAFLSDTGHSFPIAVVIAVMSISFLFVLHALLGVRKFPASWKQHRILIDQVKMLDNGETKLWYIQVITGFFLFFAGSVHLYVIFANPGSIDPYLSADRIVSGNMWLLYIILLICVVLHGNIGLYRLCLKWGWFSGKDAKTSRQMLRQLKNKLIIFYMTIGILALLVFVVIGIKHKDKVGERYTNHAATVMEETQTLEETHYFEETDEIDKDEDTEEILSLEQTQDSEQTQADEESHE